MFKVSVFENLPKGNFRSGDFTVTMDNGYEFKFYASIPVCPEQKEILHARINQFIKNDLLLLSMARQIDHDSAVAELHNSQAKENEARAMLADAMKKLTPSQFDILQKFTTPF